MMTLSWRQLCISQVKSRTSRLMHTSSFSLSVSCTPWLSVNVYGKIIYFQGLEKFQSKFMQSQQILWKGESETYFSYLSFSFRKIEMQVQKFRDLWIVLQNLCLWRLYEMSGLKMLPEGIVIKQQKRKKNHGWQIIFCSRFNVRHIIIRLCFNNPFPHLF